MSGTNAGGQTHPQPPIAPIVTLGPTTPKPDKRFPARVAHRLGMKMGLR
jgi:hypothetical protein